MHAISIEANTFIPTKGRDTNTLKMCEYHLHLIKIPSHLCAKTSYRCRSQIKAGLVLMPGLQSQEGNRIIFEQIWYSLLAICQEIEVPTRSLPLLRGWNTIRGGHPPNT